MIAFSDGAFGPTSSMSTSSGKVWVSWNSTEASVAAPETPETVITDGYGDAGDASLIVIGPVAQHCWQRSMCWQKFVSSQTSAVQALPSLHGFGALTHCPFAVLHESIVQNSPSSQLVGVPGAHWPDTQVSTPLQGLPSLHSASTEHPATTRLRHQPPAKA